MKKVLLLLTFVLSGLLLTHSSVTQVLAAVDDGIGNEVFDTSNCDPRQGNLDLSVCLKLNSTQTVGDVYSTPADLVNVIIRNLFVIAGVILFFMMMFAGFKFISGNTKGRDEAKTIMTTAVIGLIVMFSAYWIVQIIKVVTGADIIL